MDNLSDPYQVNTDQNQPVMTTEPLVPAPGTDPQPPPAPFPDDGNGELPPVPANGFQNPLPPPPPEKKNKNRLLAGASLTFMLAIKSFERENDGQAFDYSILHFSFDHSVYGD